MKVVKHDFFKLLVNLLLFPYNDVSFAFHGRTVELRVLEDVRDDVDSNWNILAEALGIVHSLFTGGICIEVSTNVLNLKLKRVL